MKDAFRGFDLGPLRTSDNGSIFCSAESADCVPAGLAMAASPGVGHAAADGGLARGGRALAATLRKAGGGGADVRCCVVSP